MIKVDRNDLAEEVANSLIGPMNGDSVPFHRIKIVEMVVGQTLDVLGEMGYLKFKKGVGVDNDKH